MHEAVDGYWYNVGMTEISTRRMSMQREDLQHLEDLQQAHQKRLRVLELKAAWQGLNAPADVLLEIEHLREIVAQMQIQIDYAKKVIPISISDSISRSVNIKNTSTKRVEVILEGDFNGLTPAVQEAAIRAIAAIVDVPPDQVAVIKVMPGSIIFQLELPEDAADALQTLYNAKDPLIRELGIKKVQLLPVSSFVAKPVTTGVLVTSAHLLLQEVHQQNILVSDSDSQSKPDVQALHINSLVQSVKVEIEHLAQGQATDTHFTYELFRRALVERNEVAREVIVYQFSSRVEQWVQHSSAFAASGENSGYFVTSVFTRFWQVITPEKFYSFPSLASLLRYLQLCANTVVIDSVRSLRSSENPCSENKAQDPFEEEIIQGIHASELWSYVNQVLQSDTERLVIHSSFVLGLKPGDIYKQHSDLFNSVSDVYRTKRDILARLSRNKQLQKFFAS